jgi:hypothetical protein
MNVGKNSYSTFYRYLDQSAEIALLNLPWTRNAYAQSSQVQASHTPNVSLGVSSKLVHILYSQKRYSGGCDGSGHAGAPRQVEDQWLLLNRRF